MTTNPKGSQRRGGLGRGLGALIPTVEPESTTQSERPLDVLFPDLQGNGSSSSNRETRGGSAKELLTPRAKTAARKNVSRETKGDRATAAAAVSRETLPADELVTVPGVTFGFLPLETVVPNSKQPRQLFEQSDLDELADSIQQVGLLQPIVVRPVPEAESSRYEIIMGERRFRAMQQLGMRSIPAIVRSTSDEDLLRDALLENLHRTDLNALEEAAAYSQLLLDFQCTQDELSERIARSRSQIANTLRLLKLPASVQKLVSAEVLSAGHARALLGLSSKEDMDALAERIVEEGLSVRMTEDLVRRIRRDGLPPSSPKLRRATPSEFAVRAASTMGDFLDTRVTVKESKGRGRIVIDFADPEDLQRIVSLVSRKG